MKLTEGLYFMQLELLQSLRRSYTVPPPFSHKGGFLLALNEHLFTTNGGNERIRVYIEFSAYTLLCCGMLKILLTKLIFTDIIELSIYGG